MRRFLSRRGWLQGLLTGLAGWLSTRKAPGAQSPPVRPAVPPGAGTPAGCPYGGCRLGWCMPGPVVGTVTYDADSLRRSMSSAEARATVTTVVYEYRKDHRA
jgi:hypothetical protein